MRRKWYFSDWRSSPYRLYGMHSSAGINLINQPFQKIRSFYKFEKQFSVLLNSLALTLIIFW